MTPQLARCHDLVVIGSGPAGQKAAVQAAKMGRSALVVEQGSSPGGACVRQGTIPSKTLRETAMTLVAFRRRTAGVFEIAAPDHVRLDSLMQRLDEVVGTHERFITDQLARNGVLLWQGRARFLGPDLLEVRDVEGGTRTVRFKAALIATGSRPRNPPELAIDHEHVLDSDSILSIPYLPRTLIVLGGGVIACEYASIFAALGVQVRVVDSAPRPLAFLDPEMSDELVQSLERTGCRYLPSRRARALAFDGLDTVHVTLDDGTVLAADKVLVALGREANVAGLGLDCVGLRANVRGHLEVDSSFRTAVPSIYAAGDVIGPPALAASAMEQGRRAACHALGLETVGGFARVPVGIYTIPEMATIGLTEAQAIEKLGGAVVGRSAFRELARGQIAATEGGFLKLVVDPGTHKIAGVHIVGEGATELVHVGQMVMLGGLPVETFVDEVLNFPTLAEAYRVAALDALNRLRAR